MIDFVSICIVIVYEYYAIDGEYKYKFVNGMLSVWVFSFIRLLYVIKWIRLFSMYFLWVSIANGATETFLKSKKKIQAKDY